MRFFRPLQYSGHSPGTRKSGAVSLTWRYAAILALALTGCATPPPAGVPRAVQEPAETAVSPEKAEPEVTPGEPAAAPSPEPDVAAPVPETLTREQFIARNDEKLLWVFEGMERAAVRKIMGDAHAPGLRNPCWTEKRVSAKGVVYEIEFYLNRMPTRSRPLGTRTLQPVIYIRDRVEAISRYQYKKLLNETHLVERDRSGCR
jgi:hypothetical protein